MSKPLDSADIHSKCSAHLVHGGWGAREGEGAKGRERERERERETESGERWRGGAGKKAGRKEGRRE